MPLAENIFTKLSTDAGVSALIGNGADARFYPVLAPMDSERPYIVSQVINASGDTILGEPSASGHHLVQLSCIAPSYLTARDLAIAVVAALDSVALAGGELCLNCTSRDGFSETVERYLVIVEADFFVPAAA